MNESNATSLPSDDVCVYQAPCGKSRQWHERYEKMLGEYEHPFTSKPTDATFAKDDHRMSRLRENCEHLSRLKGLPSGTFEVAQMCLDCGQFFRMWLDNGEKREHPEATSAYYVQIAATKLRFLADEMECHCG